MSGKTHEKPCGTPASPEKSRTLKFSIQLDDAAPELSPAQLSNLESVLSEAVAQEIARSLRFAPKVEFYA